MKHTPIYLVLQLCLIYLCTTSALEEVEQRYRRQATPAVCSRLSTETLLKTCCKTEYMAPYSMSKLQMCSNDTSVQKFANSYKLNTLMAEPSTSKTETIVIIITWCCPRGGVIIIIDQLKSATSTTCEAAAFAECMFQRNGLLTTAKTLNYNAIGNYYMRSQNNIRWQYALKSATASINSELAKLTDDQKTLVCPPLAGGLRNRQIDLSPLIAMQALQATLIKTCPEPAIYTTKNNCNQTMSNYDSCSSDMQSTSNIRG